MCGLLGVRSVLCGLLGVRGLCGLLGGFPTLRGGFREGRRVCGCENGSLQGLIDGRLESCCFIDLAQRQVDEQHAIGVHYARIARQHKPKSDITAGQLCSLSSMSFKCTVSWSSIEASLAETQESSGQQAKLNASSSKSGINSQTSRSE